MKISKLLEISGDKYHLASDIARLSLYSPGVAEFIITANAQVKGLVKFWVGNTLTATPGQAATLQQYFTGYVVRSVTAGANQQSVLVKELVNVLDNPLPLALRHVNARDVLGQISAETGLAFSMPDEKYSQQRVAYFYNMGTGLAAMDSIGKVFNIPNYIWQQNGDGTVFVGSHDHSHWKTKPVDLPAIFFASATSSNRFSCAAIPALRPGALLNGKRVSDVLLQGNTISITCED